MILYSGHELSARHACTCRVEKQRARYNLVALPT
jgi:hypothetical protein